MEHNEMGGNERMERNYIEKKKEYGILVLTIGTQSSVQDQNTGYGTRPLIQKAWAFLIFWILNLQQ
jgi:hypothetical protein